MLKKLRNCRGIFNRVEMLLAGTGIVLALGALLWYNYVHRPEEFSPEKLFEHAFIESPYSVTELTGDHNSGFGFDHWIKFKSLTPMHLRDAQEYKFTVAEVGRRWFADKWKDDRALHDAAINYEYSKRTCHDVGKVTYEALLINKNKHYYYYRYWGI